MSGEEGLQLIVNYIVKCCSPQILYTLYYIIMSGDVMDSSNSRYSLAPVDTQGYGGVRNVHMSKPIVHTSHLLNDNCQCPEPQIILKVSPGTRKLIPG